MHVSYSLSGLKIGPPEGWGVGVSLQGGTDRLHP